jgi:hypothetical protein
MPAVTMNNGTMMPSWYDIDLTQRHREDEAGLRASRGCADRGVPYCAREIARGIPAQLHQVLAGFSQG